MKMTINSKTVLILMLMILFNGFSQEKPWEKDFFEKGESLKVIHNKYLKLFESKKKGLNVSSKNNNISIVPDNDYVKFRRWEWDMQLILKEDGSYPIAAELLNVYKKEKTVKKKYSNKSTLLWENLTRKDNTGGYWGMGQTNHVEFNPNNINEFWVAGKQGGIWHTTNNGTTYVPISDDLPFQDAGAFVVDKTNTNNIMVCVGRYSGRGMGIYRTTNGGNSWNEAGLQATLSENWQFKDLKQHPEKPSVYLVATNKGIYKTVDNGNVWTKVLEGDSSAIEFKTNDSSIIYAVNRGGVYKSNNDGDSFIVLSDNPFTGTRNYNYRMTVTEAQPNKIIVYKRNNPIKVTDNGGDSWYTIQPPENGEDESIAISHVNPNILYSGSFNPFRSNDNGKTWSKIGHWYGGEGLPEVHADHRRFIMNPYTNELNSCHDGGLSVYNEANERWREVSNGILIPQYYSVASSVQDPNIIAVGSQDNGGAARKANGKWKNTNGGDASTQLIDPTDVNIRYSHYNPDPEIIRTLNDWGSTSSVVPESGLKSAWVIPMELDPNDPSTILAGYHAVYKSTNKGDDWEKISPNFSDKGDYWTSLRSLAVAPSNSDHIYAAHSREFHYSFDNGKEWKSTTFSIDITDIAVHHDKPKEVYVSCGQYDSNKKVLKSVDGGVTWSTISSVGLPNVPTTSIVRRKGANEVLYIATLLGVYYKNGVGNNWERYGTGMPYVDTRDIHINYTSEKLIAGTYGRGVYQINVANSTLSTNDLTNIVSKRGIQSYPNPVNKDIELTVSFENKEEVQEGNVLLVNTLGQVVYKNKEKLIIGVNNLKVKTSFMESGLYVVVLQVKNKEFKQKIIIRN